MKKILIALTLILFTANIYSQNSKNFTKEGKVFTTTVAKKASVEKKTDCTWVDSKGIVYPIFMNANGVCYVYKTSKKTGKEYKYYLGPELSMEVCKELGVEYKGKNSNVNRD